MARFTPVEPQPEKRTEISLFWFILWGFALSLVGVSMARKAIAQKAKVPEEGSSQGKRAEIAAGKKVQEGGEKRKREDSRVREQAKWEASISDRNVTCERMVDRAHIGVLHTVIRVLNFHGIQFLFKPVNGYIRKIVEEFYAFMVIKDDCIESTVRGKHVIISANRIAEFYGYARPDPAKIEYPHARDPEVELDSAPFVREVFAEPSRFKGKFKVGFLTNEYRLLNKIVHFNIFPRANAKAPQLYLIEFLVAIMNDEVIDFAEFIFNQMVQFRTSASPRTNLLYPYLITELCLASGCKTSEKRVIPEFGPITGGTEKKSKAASQPPPVVSSASFEPKSKTITERMDEWFRYLLCRQDDIIRNQNMVMKEVDVLRKEQRKIGKKLDYCTTSLGNLAGNPYEEAASEDEGDEEENEEDEEKDYEGGDE